MDSRLLIYRGSCYKPICLKIVSVVARLAGECSWTLSRSRTRAVGDWRYLCRHGTLLISPCPVVGLILQAPVAGLTDATSTPNNL